MYTATVISAALAYIAGIEGLLPRAVTSPLTLLMGKCMLSLALFVVVMYIGVFAKGSCAIEALGYDIDLTCLSETIDLFGGALEEIRHPLGDVRANEIRRPIPPERRAFLVALTQRLRLAADQKRKKRPFGFGRDKWAGT